MENITETQEKILKKRGSRREQIAAKKLKLREELQKIEKQETEYKNKDALKVWKKIKYLFLNDEILSRLNDKEFLDKITAEIISVMEKYLPQKETEENIEVNNSVELEQTNG